MSYSISTGKDDFYRQIFKLAIPIIIQNLLSAAVYYAELCGAVFNFCCFAGGELFEHSVYGVLWSRNRSVTFMLSVFRKKQSAGDPCGRRNCAAVFCRDFYTGGADRIYDAAADDAAVYS